VSKLKPAKMHRKMLTQKPSSEIDCLNEVLGNAFPNHP
jgi:hypothetical protein